MSYRYRLHSVPKAELEEIKHCKTQLDLCQWAKSHGYNIDHHEDDSDWIDIYEIGKEIFDLGKDFDLAFNMQILNDSIFDCEELKETYSHYGPVICSKNDFIDIINDYKERIVAYYNSLLSVDKHYTHEAQEKKYEAHIKRYKDEWENNLGHLAINTDLNTDCISNSWLYEHEIFELVRLYKTFDWENNALMLLGW